VRVWRDWALVAAGLAGTVLEAVLRDDVVWRAVSVLATVRPCGATLWARPRRRVRHDSLAAPPSAGDGRARLRVGHPADAGRSGNRTPEAGRALHGWDRPRARLRADPVGIRPGHRARIGRHPRDLRSVGGRRRPSSRRSG